MERKFDTREKSGKSGNGIDGLIPPDGESRDVEILPGNNSVYLYLQNLIMVFYHEFTCLKVGRPVLFLFFVLVQFTAVPGKIFPPWSTARIFSLKGNMNKTEKHKYIT